MAEVTYTDADGDSLTLVEVGNKVVFTITPKREDIKELEVVLEQPQWEDLKRFLNAE